MYKYQVLVYFVDCRDYLLGILRALNVNLCARYESILNCTRPHETGILLFPIVM